MRCLPELPSVLSRVCQTKGTLRCRRHKTAHQEEENAGSQERHVGGQLVRRAGQHVVDAENLVVDQAFHEVEDAPAAEHRPEERAGRAGSIRQSGGTEKPVAAEDGQDQHSEVKIAVLAGLHPGLLQGERLAVGGHADEVMPLEDLVQHDAVKEAADAQAQDATGNEEGMRSGDDKKISSRLGCLNGAYLEDPGRQGMGCCGAARKSIQFRA